jgi:adenine-specific DNA methylase
MAKAASSSGTKAQRVAKAVADAVGAGKAVQVETVDFNDPNRPKTCLEVDFPILPVNQVAAIEASSGAAKKPVYQISKWWARRQSSVFRSLLLSASMKAPEDTSRAAKAVWDVYYANHQKKRSFANLKVADIFMGGGTTVVEGSRLGMQMFGNDLNPVAWLVVKAELADVKKAEVEALLADIEAEVKPQLMPFYACNGPNGERGTWTRFADGSVMGADFDPLALKPDERKAYGYEGPEIIYVFWSKHGPCQVTGCGHRTPVMSSPVLAEKTLSVKAWPHKCTTCKSSFEIEESEARMAPDVALVVADGETRFAPINAKTGAVICPSCGEKELVNVGSRKGHKKKVALSLLVHAQWLAGEESKDKKGQPYGGSVTDDAEASARWLETRAKTLRLLEVRGKLPDEVTCPDTGVTFSTSTATIPTRSNYACGACGTVQDVLATVKASGKSGPVAPYAIQAYSPKRDRDGVAYGGRYFLPADDLRSTIAAQREWEARKDTDLAEYWPRSELPYGFMTHLLNGGIPNHGFTHWWTMFNARQLLAHALLLKAICTVGDNKHRWETREFVLAAFQNYLRLNNSFTIWHQANNQISAFFSSAHFQPKSTTVETSVFPPEGDGSWYSACRKLTDTIDWRDNPWELVSTEKLATEVPVLAADLSGKSEKALPGDAVLPGTQLACGSATDLEKVATGSFDLVITDPPFGGLLHYSELSDFFYVWLRLVLKERYPDQFTGEYTPKTLEAVSNRARHPEDSDAYYQRLLTASWKEAHRILKPGGTLAFTFHHSEDAPWVSVLESLFDAGFYLEATYPIRSDETKGDGEFGSRKIEYDIVHVCRKRTEEPTAVSWAKMRRQVLQDVRSLKHMLEHHQKAGLPEADLQVIRRGKALEYFSRHYGKVLVDDGREMKVLEALLGINQLLDEETGGIKDPPPVNAEPFTRQFLRLFDGVKEIPRDQIQKFLRGTGIAPSDFEARGWCSEDKKTYHLTSPLEVARAWQGKHRRGMTSDYDQAAFLIGACFENSGISANDTLTNDNFKPHPALSALLEWFTARGATSEIRNAASRAQTILRSWRSKHETKQHQQLALFFEDQGAS